MKRLLTLVALAATLTASAQVKVVKLWDNASAPHSNEDAGPQKEKNGNLYNTRRLSSSKSNGVIVHF